MKKKLTWFPQDAEKNIFFYVGVYLLLMFIFYFILLDAYVIF